MSGRSFGTIEITLKGRKFDVSLYFERYSVAVKIVDVAIISDCREKMLNAFLLIVVFVLCSFAGKRLGKHFVGRIC